MNYIELDIVPIAKPRMTRRDKWLNPPRPAVAQYHAFKTEIALKRNGFYLGETFLVIFKFPMPKSWSKKKQDIYREKAHKQVPDLDNCIKALCDAFRVDDSMIWHINARKIWSDAGGIFIMNTNEVERHLLHEILEESK